MCGRYVLKQGLAEICAAFACDTALTGWDPHYNAGPGMDLPVLVKGRLGPAFWGWPALSDRPLINIRSETAPDKASFRDAWTRGHRCPGSRLIIEEFSACREMAKGVRKGRRAQWFYGQGR